MKKLTLVLCACAMALAMVLVSCKNDPEKVVFDKYTIHDYMYNLSGNIVGTIETGTPGSTTTEIYTDTIKLGYANITFIEAETQELRTHNSPIFLYGYMETDRTNPNSSVDYYAVSISLGYIFSFDKRENIYKVYDEQRLPITFPGEIDATVTGNWDDDVVTISFTYVNDYSSSSSIDKETYEFTYVLTKFGK